MCAAIKACPVFGGKLVSFDESEDRRPARRAARGQGERHDGRRRRRHLVAGEDGARRAADRLGRRARAPAQSSAMIAEHLKEGLTAPGAYAVAQRGRRAQGDRGRREEGRGGLQHAVPRARDDGADELHGADHGRQGRGLGADAERRGIARRAVRGVRPAARQMRGLQARPRRRLRPARRHAGLTCARRSPSPSSSPASRSR